MLTDKCLHTNVYIQMFPQIHLQIHFHRHMITDKCLHKHAAQTNVFRQTFLPICLQTNVDRQIFPQICLLPHFYRHIISHNCLHNLMDGRNY